VCCGDPNNNYLLGCVTQATCASQSVGTFEMSCDATADCPAGTFCCDIDNPDLLITGCASNCTTFAPQGFDPTSYAHHQLCDPTRDPSCPAGRTCQIDQNIDLGVCL
jgi:hypothetical protein